MHPLKSKNIQGSNLTSDLILLHVIDWVCVYRCNLLPQLYEWIMNWWSVTPLCWRNSIFKKHTDPLFNYLMQFQLLFLILCKHSMCIYEMYIYVDWNWNSGGACVTLNLYIITDMQLLFTAWLQKCFNKWLFSSILLG